MTSSCNDCFNLPEDVMVDILLWLPIKSLIRFKCVCKNWNAIIESCHFIKQHFNHKNNQTRALVYHYKPDIQKCVFTLYNATLSRREEPNHLQFPFTVSIVGPVNGIFCVFDEMAGDQAGAFNLWNPAIREFKQLPEARPNVPPNFSAYENIIGLGLGPNDDYKVIWIQKYWDSKMFKLHYPAIISIYYSYTDSWRHLEDTDFGIVIPYLHESKSNSYLNGVYYWLAEGEMATYYILGFDMNTEAFEEIEVPNCISSLYVNLGLYKDQIAILFLEAGEISSCINLLLRKEEGFWVKQLSIGPFAAWDFSWPFVVWENGEFFVETSSYNLILVNPYTSQVWNLDAQSDGNHTRVLSYKESLVPIRRRN